jgi:hypothetical protein
MNLSTSMQLTLCITWILMYYDCDCVPQYNYICFMLYKFLWNVLCTLVKCNSKMYVKFCMIYSSHYLNIIYMTTRIAKLDKCQFHLWHRYWTCSPAPTLYRVIQEELPPLTELISEDILSKRCHINLGPILNIYRVMFVIGNALLWTARGLVKRKHVMCLLPVTRIDYVEQRALFTNVQTSLWKWREKFLKMCC